MLNTWLVGTCFEEQSTQTRMFWSSNANEMHMSYSSDGPMLQHACFFEFPFHLEAQVAWIRVGDVGLILNWPSESGACCFRMVVSYFPYLTYLFHFMFGISHSLSYIYLYDTE